MNPFVHCIHYYKAVIQFFRNNIKKVYQMHFLFFCKATPSKIQIRSFLWCDKFVFVSPKPTGSSARKRSSIQNGFSPNETVKFTAAVATAAEPTTAKSDSPTTKPTVLRKYSCSLFIWFLTIFGCSAYYPISFHFGFVFVFAILTLLCVFARLHQKC